MAGPLLSEQPVHSLVYLRRTAWRREGGEREKLCSVMEMEEEESREGILCYDGRGGGRKEGV